MSARRNRAKNQRHKLNRRMRAALRRCHRADDAQAVIDICDPLSYMYVELAQEHLGLPVAVHVQPAPWLTRLVTDGYSHDVAHRIIDRALDLASVSDGPGDFDRWIRQAIDDLRIVNLKRSNGVKAPKRGEQPS